MMNENKIKISYEDLADKRIDETIARWKKSSKNIKNIPLSIKYSIYKRWIYLIIAIVIGLLIAWGIVEIFRSILQEKRHVDIALIMAGNI